MTRRLGVIADDYTGATDIAVMLAKGGLRVVQSIGVPRPADPWPDADVVVVALKSRTIPAEDAVGMSLQSLEWLQNNGASQIVFKYCSTFDSTAEGNIGPVADALLAALGAPIACLCPAMPANGRTVYGGQLFVGADLLARSPMKDHPLTPMRDSDLLRLMDAQSIHAAGLVPHAIVVAGADAVKAAIQSLSAEGKRYAVIDAINDADLLTLGAAVHDMPLVTGASGVAMGLPRAFGAVAPTAPVMPDIAGRAAVLAGSCSSATRRQIAAVQGNWPVRKVDPDQIAAGAPVAADAVAWAADCIGIPVIFASASPQEVEAKQARYGMAAAGRMIEDTLAEIARGLVARGFRRLVVAGGETSGAVLNALGVDALHIFSEIAPGVPWTTSADGHLALALKSGNFGGPDFFEHAFEALS